MRPKRTVTVESEDSTSKLAILIDADNAQPSSFEFILAEIAKFGETTVKRIYGDFTASSSSQWRSVLNKFAIKPVQQFAYTKGKNVTDSTMIIDAMDLMYTKRFDGFCIISSDSDFTGLASRIREEGLLVYGFGRNTTPESFVNACHKFISIELLMPKSAVDINPMKSVSQSKEVYASQSESQVEALPVDMIINALNESALDDGWTNIAAFGEYLRKVKPDFDPRKYGAKKLSTLIKTRTDVFDFEERQVSGSESRIIYVRPHGK